MASVMASASTAISGTLLPRSPLRGKPQGLSFCFKNSRLPMQRRRLFNCSAIYSHQVQIKEEGRPETLDYRVFFLDNSWKKISPWHDVPLQLGDSIFNFIVEIPKESSAKMEVATDELFTPIKQDTKKGKLRYYPYNINWNYGLLPQTWEDPSFANDEVEGAFGDNDPVDVVEIGEKPR
ncbi:Soluble inorganic pyrophosphatase 6, chloroplastic [Orobanche minor]